MSNQDLIAALNNQLNREVTTFLRYMLQAAQIRGTQWEPVREMYLKEVSDEVGHAQYLANQISVLGGTPKLAPDLAPPPTDPKQMLEADAQAEKADVHNYIELARMADELAMMGLKVQMENQAADEDEHRQEMLRMLGR